MTYRGQVKNGVVVLKRGATLAEGTEVRIEPLKKSKKKGLTVGEEMLKFAGIVRGLPSDLAENHDHYLHGRPKK